MSTHSINVDGLVALDVHVHLEHTGEETEADKKAAEEHMANRRKSGNLRGGIGGGSLLFQQPEE